MLRVTALVMGLLLVIGLLAISEPQSLAQAAGQAPSAKGARQPDRRRTGPSQASPEAP